VDKQGSVILMVLMLLAVLTIAGFTVLRNNIFLVDGLLMREQYTKQYHATEGLMRYGIGLGTQYFDALKHYQKEITVEVGAWPLNTSLYTGKLLFMPNEQGIKIQALLEKENQTCCTITSLLVHNEGAFELRNWHIR
jgi:hypothetical protein